MDLTLRRILAEVLLYTDAAMTLTVGCQPEGTSCRCYYFLTSEMCFADGIIAVDTIAMETLALKDLVPANGGVELPAAALPELLFLAISAAA
jgi:hypothetical protein